MATVDDSSDAPSPRRGFSFVLLGASALAAAAVVVAVWFGVAWISAASDESLGRATVRDEVDRVARQAIITFNTLDYRKVDEGLDNWLNASTGPLHNEVVGRRSSSKQIIESAKTTTKAEVLSLAITDLNEFDGKATVIAALKMNVATEGKEPVTKYQRIQGSLQRVDNGWKLNSIGLINVPAG